MIEMTISDRPKTQCMSSKKEEYVSQTVCGGIVDIIYNALFSHTKMANINRLKKSLAWCRMFPNNINMHTSSNCPDHCRDTWIVPSSHNSIDVTILKATKPIQPSTTLTQSIMKSFTVTTCGLCWVWRACPGQEKAVSFIPCGSSFVLFETNYTDAQKHRCFS